MPLLISPIIIQQNVFFGLHIWLGLVILTGYIIVYNVIHSYTTLITCLMPIFNSKLNITTTAFKSSL